MHTAHSTFTTSISNQQFIHPHLDESDADGTHNKEIAITRERQRATQIGTGF
jgi:hypothetical protein